MRTLRSLSAGAVLVLAALPVPARPAATPPATRGPSAERLALGRLRLAIERTTLDNGLSVVLDVDRTAPTVTVAVLYRVGARDETDARSGSAALLEQMTFEGSKHLAPGKLAALVAARGGRTSSSIDHDRTLFLDELPAGELPLGLWLEAERMRWATLPASRFPALRQAAVTGARRVLSTPLEHAALRLPELVFQGLRPYSRPARGSPAELARASPASVRALYKNYYAPDNAVLVIAGSFDPARAMELVHRHFGGVPRRKTAAEPRKLSAPHQTSERVTVIDSAAPASALFNGWVVPAAGSAEHEALELLAGVLAGGESSRLRSSLVRMHGLARDVSAWTDGRHGPDLFGIRVLLADGASPERVQKLVDAELRRLRRHGPDAAELRRARALSRTRFLLGLQSNRQRAVRLAEAEAFGGDARLVTERLDRLDAVRPSAIAAAARYLARQHRTVVQLGGGTAPAKPRATHASRARKRHHHPHRHHSRAHRAAKRPKGRVK